MGGAAAVNAVPIVGRPVAYGTGFIALVVLGLSRFVAQYFVTLAHEGGHMLTALVIGRRIHSFRIEDSTGGGTRTSGGGGFIANVMLGFLGYPASALLGVGGAALIAANNPWAVLFVAALLSTLALLVSRGGLAFLIPALVVSAIVAAAFRGSPALQAGLAAGIVWFLLLAGVGDAATIPLGDDDPQKRSDAAVLARQTLVIPAFLWKLIWVVIAVVSLYVGGRLLLLPGG